MGLVPSIIWLSWDCNYIPQINCYDVCVCVCVCGGGGGGVSIASSILVSPDKSTPIVPHPYQIIFQFLFQSDIPFCAR